MTIEEINVLREGHKRQQYFDFDVVNTYCSICDCPQPCEVTQLIEYIDSLEERLGEYALEINDLKSTIDSLEFGEPD